MKKEKSEPSIKDRLQVGDKIFYHDGYTSFDIEEVVSINKPEKYAVLSNNAHISRYPNHDGTFNRLNPTGANLPVREGMLITKATPELMHRRDAVIAKKRIHNYLYNIEQDLLKRAELRPWNTWSESLQNELIVVCGHLAKAIEEEPLSDSDKELLDKVLREDPETNVVVPSSNEPKKKKRK